MTSRLYLLFWVVLAPCGSLGDEPRPITKAEDVLAIYTEDWGLGASTQPKLVFCAWADGFVVWSHHRTDGGAPYFIAQLNPKLVSDSLDRLDKRGAFSTPKLGNANFGPDSQFTTILVRHDRKELKMQSWHELFEAGGKTVAADHGIESLAGRKLLNVLSQQSPEYLHYRMAWLELRLAAANLIPSSGTKSTGELRMLHGIASWTSSDDQ